MYYVLYIYCVGHTNANFFYNLEMSISRYFGSILAGFLEVKKLLSILQNDGTVGICNEEKVDRHRIIPYCESFPYGESGSFIKSNFGKHQHSIIVSYYAIVKSLIASSDCSYIAIFMKN